MNKHMKALGFVGVIMMVSFLFMDTIFKYDNKYNGYHAPIENGGTILKISILKTMKYIH